jgi:hypothetical protein
VSAVAFAPDGRRLLSGSSDTSVLVWDLIGPPTGAARPPVADLWAELLNADATKADAAARWLIGGGDATAKHLWDHLTPAPAPDAASVRKLIDDLDSTAFADREAAGKELERLGDVVLPALSAAARASESAEVRRRCADLLGKLDRTVLSGEALRQARAVEVLERIGTPVARKVLDRAAAGPAGTFLAREAAAAVRRLGEK